jgi:beta-carotene hydroxylase
VLPVPFANEPALTNGPALRFAADVRTLLWLGLATALAAVQYARPELIPYLWPVSCYFALACGTIAHNHNHCPTFASPAANQFFAFWVSIFYGYPAFGWIPTHNMNHHKYVNRSGDATIGWRYSKKHSLWVALSYFFFSSYWQSDPIRAFIAKARSQSPSLYRRILWQYAVFLTVHAALLALAIALYGLARGALVYGMVTLLPSLFALWSVMLLNYEQHIHADPWSAHNHSRSWDGRLLNFLLFNNGLHAAHHESPGTHWSLLREDHDALAPSIDPRLIHSGLWAYLIRQYALSPFLPRLGTVQVGRAAYDAPDGAPAIPLTADVELGEAGANAQMARI